VGKLGYRPALDGVRALAIVPVVGLHAFGWPRQGALGVEIFFVLSGFLITTGATAYDHRFWRSTAAILVALGVATAAFFFVEQPLRRRWRHPRPAPEERAPETKHILVS